MRNTHTESNVCTRMRMQWLRYNQNDFKSNERISNWWNQMVHTHTHSHTNSHGTMCIKLKFSALCHTTHSFAIEMDWSILFYFIFFTINILIDWMHYTFIMCTDGGVLCILTFNRAIYCINFIVCISCFSLDSLFIVYFPPHIRTYTILTLSIQSITLYLKNSHSITAGECEMGKKFTEFYTWINTQVHTHILSLVLLLLHRT